MSNSGRATASPEQVSSEKQDDARADERPANLLKVRDDPGPIGFSAVENSDGVFRLQQGCEAAWSREGEFTRKDLRNRIEPWLTSLFQSEHLSLLIGAGLTHAVHHLAAGGAAASTGKFEFQTCGAEINSAAQRSAEAAERDTGNMEDQLRVANELLRGLEIIQDERVEALKKEIQEVLKGFADSVLRSERGIVEGRRVEAADSGNGAKQGGETQNEGYKSERAREEAFNILVTFLMSFASRIGVRDRLHIFTTNYDRLIEAGAELAGLHLLDRFLGNLMPIFRSSRLDLDMHYNPPGIRGEPRYLEGVARYTKLHGSLDWVQAGRDIRRIGLPFGAESVDHYLKAPGLYGATPHELMIYPNAAKDRETAGYPYVELFRDFATAVCRPNSTLVTYGYSFGDEHINRVIRDMLTIPSTHLVVISFDGKPLGRIRKTYEELGRTSQISLMVGPELGDLGRLTRNYLPKSAIDRTTFRMSELLKQRWGAQYSEGQGLIPNTVPSIAETAPGLAGTDGEGASTGRNADEGVGK